MTARNAPIRIGEFQPGQRLDDEVMLLARKELRTTAKGDLYIHAVFNDATGSINARMWNASKDIYDSMPDTGLIRIRGRVETYQGKLQLIIDGVQTIDPDEGYDVSDFLPRTEFDINEMWDRVKEILRTIENRDLLALVGEFVNDPVFVDGFRKSPAARNNHHAFVGGLLEHTLNLMELALLICPRYPRVDQDLVLAGIFLHDCGKMTELGHETNFEYTDSGQLVGHITQAAIWVHDRAGKIAAERGEPLPERLLNCLTHLIVAHHGKYEFGSPRLPATAEAFLLHHLDNLDAKLNMVFGAIDRDADPDRDWSDWVPALETRVYKRQP